MRTRPNGSREESLEKRLARVLSASTGIDTSSDTEHKKSVPLVEFVEAIVSFTSDKNETGKEVRQHIDCPDKQSLRMDRLHLDSERAEAGVAWWQTKWKTWKTYLRRNNELLNAELYCIGETLSTSLKGKRSGRGGTSWETTTRLSRFHISVDSRTAIVQLQLT